LIVYLSNVDKWHDLGDPFVYVTGCYLSVSTTSAVTAESFIQHLIHSVLFLKDRDIVLSSDAWHVALGLNVSTYEDVLSTIKSDLSIILLNKQDFTPISELRQVETLLDNLETKLYQFKQLFPKKETRRSLMNFGGTVLRTLFGTATVADLHRLHEALGELQDKNSEVVHSLSKQVTYIRNLNSVTSLNTEALVNLTTRSHTTSRGNRHTKHRADTEQRNANRPKQTKKNNKKVTRRPQKIRHTLQEKVSSQKTKTPHRAKHWHNVQKFTKADSRIKQRKT